VSLSSLAHDLDSGLATIQWVTSGYLLALGLMLPLNGWLVDRIGANTLYLWCYTRFALSSALCGLVWSAHALVGFRILQGMSGGLLTPMAQMLIARAAGRHMAQVVGISALPVLLAPLLGPVVAGAILQFASWRWLFLINLPVGVLALGSAFLVLADDRGEARPRSLDFLGLALLSPALALFLYGTDHLGAPPGAAALVCALLMLGRQNLPMATAAMNIVQRLDGPTLTTLCATFLAWRLAATQGNTPTSGAFAASFGLLSFLRGLCVWQQ
jgi:MFS family permease